MRRLGFPLVVLLFLAAVNAAFAAPGEVLDYVRVGEGSGGFSSDLSPSDSFGRSLAVIGDLDEDGNEDLAVGYTAVSALRGAQPGGLFILFMNSDGTVKSEVNLTSGTTGLDSFFGSGQEFGATVAAIGDIDGDLIPDLAVGAPTRNTAPPRGGSPQSGSVLLLFLNRDGSVKSIQEITEGIGGFSGLLDSGDRFGSSIAAIGDLDGDFIPELAVGAIGDDDARGNPASSTGAVWILFMNSNGTVRTQQKISDTNGGFGNVFILEPLEDSDLFGYAVTSLGDMNGDLIPDIAVGAPGDLKPPGMTGATGTVYVLFLNDDGTVDDGLRIRAGEDDQFPPVPGPEDRLGSSLTTLPDTDNNGFVELVVGLPGDNDSPPPIRGSLSNRGAIYILSMGFAGDVLQTSKISSVSGRFDEALTSNSVFGSSVATFGDLNDDGVPDLAVGAPGQDSSQGAVYNLFLRNDGEVLDAKFITQGSLGFDGTLSSGDFFGSAVSRIGDINGDGVNDLAVGARGDSTTGTLRGAVWILFLDEDDSVIGHQKINELEGNFPEPLRDGDTFGVSVAGLGDLDGDGTNDIAVGASGDDGLSSGTRTGAVYILFLKPDGTVKTAHKIWGSDFLPLNGSDHNFGQSVAWIGEYEYAPNQFATALAIGIPSYTVLPPIQEGGVLLAAIDESGSVLSSRFINTGMVPYVPDSLFGQSVAFGGESELLLPGTSILHVGAPLEGPHGAIYTIYFDSGFNPLLNFKNTTTELTNPAPAALSLLFGWSLAGLGNLDGGGENDLIIGTLPDLGNGPGFVTFWGPGGIDSYTQFRPLSTQPIRGGVGQDGPEQFGFSYDYLGTRSQSEGALVAVGAPRFDVSETERDAGGVWLMRFRAIGGTLPATAIARPVLHVEVPEGTAAEWLYTWESDGDDQPISNGPTPLNEDEVHEGDFGATFNEGETWTVTVTPFNEFGEPGDEFVGSFVVGPGGGITFEGWTVL